MVRGRAAWPRRWQRSREGFDVQLHERHPEVRAAENILNLWPPPQKVLKLIGVDTDDLGAPCHVTFRNAQGKRRVDVCLTPEVEREYGGGFIGLLRWSPYERMLAALRPGVMRLDHDLIGLEDRDDDVLLRFDGREPIVADAVVGADGINSTVRRIFRRRP